MTFISCSHQKIASVSGQVQHPRPFEIDRQRTGLPTLDGYLKYECALIGQGLVEIESRTVTGKWLVPLVLAVLGQLFETEDSRWSRTPKQHLPRDQGNQYGQCDEEH